MDRIFLVCCGLRFRQELAPAGDIGGAAWQSTTFGRLQFVHLLFLWWLPCNEVIHEQQTERNTQENQLFAL
jgi:hypothetical protein